MNSSSLLPQSIDVLIIGATFAVEGRTTSAAAEHRAIVEAIAARDPESAEAAARSHISSAQRLRLRMILEDDES